MTNVSAFIPHWKSQKHNWRAGIKDLNGYKSWPNGYKSRHKNHLMRITARRLEPPYINPWNSQTKVFTIFSHLYTLWILAFAPDNRVFTNLSIGGSPHRTTASASFHFFSVLQVRSLVSANPVHPRWSVRELTDFLGIISWRRLCERLNKPLSFLEQKRAAHRSIAIMEGAPNDGTSADPAMTPIERQMQVIATSIQDLARETSR